MHPHLLQALMETRQRDLLNAAHDNEIAAMARAASKAERRANRAARRAAAAGTADSPTTAIDSRLRPNLTALKLWLARRRMPAGTPATSPGE
jgi:hypothetical protein